MIYDDDDHDDDDNHDDDDDEGNDDDDDDDGDDYDDDNNDIPRPHEEDGRGSKDKEYSPEQTCWLHLGCEYKNSQVICARTLLLPNIVHRSGVDRLIPSWLMSS